MRLKQLISQKNIFNFWCYILIASLFYSKFMLSVSIFALVFLSIVRIVNQEKISFVFNKLFLDSFKKLLRHPAYLAVAILFFVYVCSGINTQNTQSWLDHLIVKIPLLAFPIIFLNRPPVGRTEYRNLFYCLAAVSLVSAIHVSINYLINFDEITYSIGSGHTIPTPTHHTRYSIMVAIGVLSIVALHLSKFTLSKIEKTGTVVVAIFLFLFLHVLSIRSGLLALYLGIFVLGVLYLLQERRYSLLILFLLSLSLAPLIAYNTIPSFYNKVHYTRYDLKMNKEGKGENYSDSERILSIKTGLDLLLENPILGTGIGDLDDRVSQKYLEDYKKTIVKLPHNQFVFVLAGTGLLLGIIYLLCFFVPILYQKNYKDLMMLALFIGITVLCMVEKPLERSNFIAFFGLFVCAGISFNMGQKIKLEKTKEL